MPDCPKCRSALARRKNDFGVFWYCGACDGSAVTMSLLRKMIPSDAMNGLWQRARLGSYPRKCRCPGCNRKMEEISVAAEGQTRAIDVCTSCQFVWLDEGEWADLAFFAVEEATPEAMREAVRAQIEQKRRERSAPVSNEIAPPLPKARVEPPKLPKARAAQPPKLKRVSQSPEAVERSQHSTERVSRQATERRQAEQRTDMESRRRAMEKRSKAARRQPKRESGSRKDIRPKRREAPIKRKSGWGEGPEQSWQWIPALLGMPVEDEQPQGRRQHDEKPVFTWFLAIGIVVVSLLAMLDLNSVIEAYGLIPAEYGRGGGLTWLTAFFIHGGLLHLVGNVYFLVVFGDNVEKCLGTIEFFLLLCLATLSGHFVHILMDPSSTVPCIGASGGISGVMAFYALRFRNHQLAVMFWLVFKTYWLRMSALPLFGIWVFLQLITAGQQMAGVSHISGGAHLGGALAGVFAWLVWRLNNGRAYTSETVG
ncbi:MAG: rhomboid family intramembrane serine protease [Opitutaceae bacterium]